MRAIELNAENLIAEIEFTEQDYYAIVDSECSSFEQFVIDIITMTKEQGGTLEDAIVVAEDAYTKICEANKVNIENLIAEIDFTEADYNKVSTPGADDFKTFIGGIVEEYNDERKGVRQATEFANYVYNKMVHEYCENNPEEDIIYWHDLPGVTYQAAGDYSLANPDCDMGKRCIEEGVKLFGESFRTVEIGFMECFPYPSYIGNKELEKKAAEVARFLIEYEDHHAVYTLYKE